MQKVILGDNDGIEINVEKALLRCKKSVEQNNIPAQCMRGRIHLYVEEDIEMAAMCYLKAKEQVENEDDPKAKI